MTPLISRLFLYLDEWGYLIGLCYWVRLWLAAVWLTEQPGFRGINCPDASRKGWIALAWGLIGGVMVYAIGYRLHFRITGEHPW